MDAPRVTNSARAIAQVDRCDPTHKHECSEYCMKRQKLLAYHTKWFEDNWMIYLHCIFCFLPSMCGARCMRANRLFNHTLNCPEREYGTCHFCRPMMMSFAANHTRFCYQGDNCAYPYCGYIRRRKEAKLPLFKVYKKVRVSKDEEGGGEHSYDLRPRKIIETNEPDAEELNRPGPLGLCNLPAGIVFRPAKPPSPQAAAYVTNLLLMILHAYRCRRQEEANNRLGIVCTLDSCKQMKDTFRHMRTCPANICCPENHCANIRMSLFHWRNCGMLQTCPVCMPIVQMYRNQRNADRNQKCKKRRLA